MGNRSSKDTSQSTTRRGDDVDRAGSTDSLLKEFVGKETKFMQQLANQHREVMGAIEKTTAELAQMRRASIPRCHHCKKRGHTIEQCFKLHPPLAKPDAQPAGKRGGDAVHAVTAYPRGVKMNTSKSKSDETNPDVFCSTQVPTSRSSHRSFLKTSAALLSRRMFPFSPLQTAERCLL